MRADDPVMYTSHRSVRMRRSTNGSQPGTAWISSKKQYTVSACFFSGYSEKYASATAPSPSRCRKRSRSSNRLR